MDIDNNCSCNNNSGGLGFLKNICGGNNCIWIILIVVVLFCCCGKDNICN